LEQLESTITADEKKKIDDLIGDLETATKNEDFSTTKELMENLKNTMMEVGEKAYSSENNESSSNEDVIDTDFSAEKK
jgi:hypothetical protein